MSMLKLEKLCIVTSALLLLLVSTLSEVHFAMPQRSSSNNNVNVIGITSTTTTSAPTSSPYNISGPVAMEWEQYFAGLGRKWGDSAMWVIQTSDGGYAIAGGRNYSPSQVVVAKANASGILEWSRKYDIGYKVAGFVQISDGGYVVGTGVTLLKIDSKGKAQWSRTYPQGGFRTSMVQTSDGGYALAGIAGWDSEVWLVKADFFGKLQWNRTYGERLDGVAQLIQTSDGGYAIAGSNNSYSGEGGDLWLLKTDTAGTLLWSKSYNEKVSGQVAKSVTQISDGGYVLADNTRSYLPMLIKTDSSGNVEWNRTYATGGEVNSVIATSDGGLAFVGRLSPPTGGPLCIWLVKADSSGNVELNQTYGNKKYREYGYMGQSVIETRDGSLAVAGAWTKSTWAVYYYLAKTQPILPPASPSPSPPSNQSPTAKPETILIIILIAVLIGTGLAILFRKGKRRKNRVSVC